MADVTPKIKTYLFISLICLLINLGVYITSLVSSPNNALNGFILSTMTSFLPFFDIVSMAFLNLPSDIFIMMGIILGIFGFLKAYFLVVIIANFIPLVDV